MNCDLIVTSSCLGGGRLHGRLRGHQIAMQDFRVSLDLLHQPKHERMGFISKLPRIPDQIYPDSLRFFQNQWVFLQVIESHLELNG